MSVQRRYACDACGESFWVTLESRKAPPPECPYCSGSGEKSAEAMVWISKSKREADDVTRRMVADGKAPGVPTQASLYIQSSDQVFRAMESGADLRAKEAASTLNVPVSEMSNLKITDMHDAPKTGEISAKVPMSQEGMKMNQYARQMSFSANTQAQGAAYAKATQQGPAAGKHGTNMAGLLRDRHAQTEAIIRSRGH